MKACEIWLGFCAAALAVAVPGVVRAAGGESAASVAVAEATPRLLQAHCVKCHGPDEAHGGVRLDSLPARIDSAAAGERWQQVLGVLNSGEMPPQEEPQLDLAAKTDLLDDLARVLVVARKALADSWERPTVRRLNRREYANTIRELLGISIDVRQLPLDEPEGSFDTFASTLFMSPDQFETYRALGKQAIADAFRTATLTTVQKTRTDPEESWNKFVKDDIAAFVSSQKRLAMWKKALEAAARRPENAQAVKELKEQFKDDPLALVRGAEKLTGAPAASEFAFLDPLEALVADNNFRAYFHRRIDSLTLPLSDRGVYLGKADFDLQAPAPGNYTIRVRAARIGRIPLYADYERRKSFLLEAPDPSRYFIEVGDRYDPFQPLAIHEVTGTEEKPEEIVWTVRLEPGRSQHFQIRERGNSDGRPQAMAARSATHSGFGIEAADPKSWIVTIGNPPVPRATDDPAAVLLRDKVVPTSPDVLFDAASVILAEGTKRFRLPKPLDPAVAAAYEQPFATGWPRGLREVATERSLLNAAGTFYVLPRVTSGGAAKILPVCSHGKRITDFCSWRGLLVLGGVRQGAAGWPINATSRVIGSTDASGKAAQGPAVWVGDIDELWRLPPPTGRGGPWHETAVAAGVPSDPYLMGGYDEKMLELSHDDGGTVRVAVEIDPTGDGEWFDYATLEVPAGKPVTHRFPEGFLAQWVRLTADSACRATATLTYR